MKKYLSVIFAIVTIFLLTVAFDLEDAGGVRLRFGTVYFNDTASGYASINKGLKVNGELILKSGENFTAGSDVLMTNGIFRFGDADAEYGQTGISGSNTNGEILYTASQHNFWNNSAAMFQIDSATATNTNTNFTKLGASAPAIKQVQLTGIVPAVSGSVNMAHGLSNISKILTIDFNIRDDSTNRVLPKGSNFTTGLSPGLLAYATVTNIVYFTPAASINLPNDTIRVLITYIQ